MKLFRRPEEEMPEISLDIEKERIKNDETLSEKEKEKELKKISRKQVLQFLKKGGKIN